MQALLVISSVNSQQGFLGGMEAEEHYCTYRTHGGFTRRRDLLLTNISVLSCTMRDQSGKRCHERTLV